MSLYKQYICMLSLRVVLDIIYGNPRIFKVSFGIVTCDLILSTRMADGVIVAPITAWEFVFPILLNYVFPHFMTFINMACCHYIWNIFFLTDIESMISNNIPRKRGRAK